MKQKSENLPWPKKEESDNVQTLKKKKKIGNVIFYLKLLLKKNCGISI